MNNTDFKKIKIPDKPGVYFFLKNKEIIYIGKATSLKDRVKSYFSKELFNMRGPLLVDMVTKTTEIKWQETDSVLEALILEANLIKKHQPIYNTKEKSDKSFNYVCITKDILPKVIIRRGKDLLQNRGNFSVCYGPYPNGSQLKEALKIVRRIFPFLDDKSKNSYEFYRQIGLSPLLIEEGAGGGDYKKNIRNIKLFFEGKKTIILKDLEKEMKSCAKRHEFEKAGEIKRQIFALKHIQDVSLIKAETASHHDIFPRLTLPGVPGGAHTQKKYYDANQFRIEAYDIAHMSGKDMVGVMVVIEDGEPNKKEYRKFKIKNYSSSNDVGALREVLERRFAHTEWPYPKLIVIDGGKAQLNAVKKFQDEVGLAIQTVSVVKDEKHQPKGILNLSKLDLKGVQDPTLESLILLANHEAHRFAISYHRNLRGKII
ncbi:MAG: GIY-YIG nuclease family protein [Minisyncoccia bacterium]